MSLLRDIQNSAVSSESKVTDLLRKCKILAARLGNKNFELWIENELSGYKSKEKLPSYRIIRNVEIKGHFGGPFGSGLRNASIPPACLDKKIQEILISEYLMSGISVYEELLFTSDTGTFQVSIPSDFLVLYGDKIYENMSCLEAWKVIPRGIIVGLIDDVRNRVLSFALEIEKVNPEAGEAPLNTEPIPQKSVSQIFNTHIYGNIGAISSGNENTVQYQTININNNFDGLKQELQKLGINDDDIKSLENSIKGDKHKDKEQLGEKTTSWLLKMISKAASGALKISIATATEVLPKLICNYLGIS